MWFRSVDQASLKKCRSEVLLRKVDQKKCRSEVSIRKRCGSEVLVRCRSKVSLRSVNQKQTKCRSEVLLRSVDLKKCGSEVLIRCRSRVSLRSVNEKCNCRKCCSEVLMRRVPQKCRSEVSIRSVAQKCRSEVGIQQGSPEVSFRSVDEQCGSEVLVRWTGFQRGLNESREELTLSIEICKLDRFLEDFTGVGPRGFDWFLDGRSFPRLGADRFQARFRRTGSSGLRDLGCGKEAGLGRDEIFFGETSWSGFARLVPWNKLPAEKHPCCVSLSGEEGARWRDQTFARPGRTRRICDR